MLSAAILLALPALTLAQTCQPDVLVDDFGPRNSSLFRTQGPGEGCEQFNSIPGTFNGCNKTLNYLLGDYGDQGVNETMTLGKLSLLTFNVSEAINNLESASHPLTAISFNYWFTKFNWINDFDLTPFTGFSIDLIAPVGSDFNITLTQWIPADPQHINGSGTRGIDSEYRLMSSYITPNGSPQTLKVPFADLATNLLGDPYDFKNLKDLTLVNLGPVGATFVFTKIMLLGNCTTSSLTTTTSAKAGATGTASGGISNTVAVGTGGAAASTTGVATTTSKSGAEGGVVGFVWATMAGLMAAMLL
ncbi:hypothetical protein HK101_009717 [Irineochytrium annulatum]|nr:hypothetical protein HK101_009717 [Irineochytrium annulatum]